MPKACDLCERKELCTFDIEERCLSTRVLKNRKEMRVDVITINKDETMFSFLGISDWSH